MPTPPKEPRLSVFWALPSEEPNEREKEKCEEKKNCYYYLIKLLITSAFVSITNNNDQNKTKIKVNDQIYSNLIKFSTRS
jgi:hypothetical protein